jgi:hypothetical protein
LLAACIVLLSATNAHATSYAWNVLSGDWFTPTNWTPNGTPGSSDNVTIGNGGTCTLNSAVAITNLTLSNGTLAGTGTLTVGGSTSWTGGSMTGAGTTIASGGLALSGAGNSR